MTRLGRSVTDGRAGLDGPLARNRAGAREAVRSFRAEANNPGRPWDAALHFERATQMWSMRRRETA